MGIVPALFWLCLAAIGYTYVGYPALLALLARVRRPARPWPAVEPAVTLLIAAHNEQEVIAGKLDNSLALDYPRQKLQIVVAADGSDDGTPGIVRSYGGRGVELSFIPARQGKMAAINRAMSAARGEIVVFSDANNMYAPDMLRQLVAPFADPGVGAVTGAKVILKSDDALGESEGLYWRYESFIKRQETRLGSCTGAAGEVFAIRRNLFRPPPAGVINDDFVLAMQVVRSGYRVVYAPGARSFERASTSAQDEIVRRTRIIAGRYQAIAMAPRLLPLKRPLAVWQVVSHKFLRPLVPFFMAGAMMASLLSVAWPAQGSAPGWLILAFPANWLALALQAVFYGLAGLGRRLSHRGGLGRLLYLPTFLLDSNLAAVIGLYRFLTGGQSALWQRVPRRADVYPLQLGNQSATTETACEHGEQ